MALYPPREDTWNHKGPSQLLCMRSIVSLVHDSEHVQSFLSTAMFYHWAVYLLPTPCQGCVGWVGWPGLTPAWQDCLCKGGMSSPLQTIEHVQSFLDDQSPVGKARKEKIWVEQGSRFAPFLSRASQAAPPSSALFHAKAHCCCWQRDLGSPWVVPGRASCLPEGHHLPGKGDLEASHSHPP